jgi:hypothetical protein
MDVRIGERTCVRVWCDDGDGNDYLRCWAEARQRQRRHRPAGERRSEWAVSSMRPDPSIFTIQLARCPAPLVGICCPPQNSLKLLANSLLLNICGLWGNKLFHLLKTKVSKSTQGCNPRVSTLDSVLSTWSTSTCPKDLDFQEPIPRAREIWILEQSA